MTKMTEFRIDGPQSPDVTTFTHVTHDGESTFRLKRKQLLRLGAGLMTIFA